MQIFGFFGLYSFKNKMVPSCLCSRLNRCTKYLLEQGLKEKSEAQCIDNSCALMTTHSANNLQKHNNTTALQR